MSDLILYEDKYYILATSQLADDRIRVLKHGDAFAVFDRRGDIHSLSKNDQGLFHDETRHLSHFQLQLGDALPLLLNSMVKESNDAMTADFTNPKMLDLAGNPLPQGTLHLERAKFLWDSTAYESIALTHFGQESVEVEVAFTFEADFADLFEVRGVVRDQHGDRLPPEVLERRVVLAYRGRDAKERRTTLTFSETPLRLDSGQARFRVSLAPHQVRTLYLSISCSEQDGSPVNAEVFSRELAACQAELLGKSARNAVLETSNQTFNHWLDRSREDLDLLLTRQKEGLYPYAGIPWYSTQFGRDGIITALECLWINPDIAKGVLAYLAANQARELDAAADAEPGKILHEARRGEMAQTGEVPFRRYYGTVDATPLFVVLAGRYWQHTADKVFLASLWPNIMAALEWIDRYGDMDGDGFVEYQRKTAEGLNNQGWKDSMDSIFHSDGSLAEGPIALCEVQGYVYEARELAAEMAEAMGESERAASLRTAAESLRQNFHRAFYSKEIGMFVPALDGDKQPCRVRASNAGHCLFSGIALPEAAAQVGESLLKADFFSGWGIRTVSFRELRYNPLSYHNGSVWPHDNALVAMGLARYGLKDGVLKILTGIYGASRFFEGYRLPELFCGFTRQPGQSPTQYPVACSPQAWSVASVYYLLQACLGLSIDASRQRIRFDKPVLPPYIRRMDIRNLKVGRATVDLALTAHDHSVGVDVLKRDGDVEVAFFQ